MLCWRKAVAVAAVLASALFPVFAASARPPAERVATLQRGVNITGWFRYPVSRDPSALRAYMHDDAIEALRRSGFTFVRLAVDPVLVEDRGALAAVQGGVQRLTRAGLGVVVSLHPPGHPVPWRLEQAGDALRLRQAWRQLAVVLRSSNPAFVFPELVNEPVFSDDPAGWHRLQLRLLADVRVHLPAHTVVLTGHDWGSIAGLLGLPPVADGNVVYSFHFYDPAELTALAAYRPGLDRASLARLPFPVGDAGACTAQAGAAPDTATADLMRFYCSLGWDETRIRAQIGRASAWARAHDAVVLAGEFGATAALNPMARRAWLRTVREALEANSIGWALWGYDDIMGYAVTRPPLRHPVLDVVVSEALGLSVNR